MKCKCGTESKDLPFYLLTGSDEEHMFSRCNTCGESFCSCGQQHTEELTIVECEHCGIDFTSRFCQRCATVRYGGE